MTRSRFHPDRESKCVSHVLFPQKMWDALPDRVKNHITDLEQQCDQTGNVQQIASLTEQRDALVEQVKELKEKAKTLAAGLFFIVFFLATWILASIFQFS